MRVSLLTLPNYTKTSQGTGAPHAKGISEAVEVAWISMLEIWQEEMAGKLHGLFVATTLIIASYIIALP